MQDGCGLGVNESVNANINAIIEQLTINLTIVAQRSLKNPFRVKL